MPAAASARVDRYDLLELIGPGAFGAVYRARHVHTGQLHALKLARGSLDAVVAARVLSEARAAEGLRHPNIVSVSDGGVTSDGAAFVVMELLEGATVADLIAGGPLALERAAINDDPGDKAIARCCAQAMKDAQWPGFSPGESGIYSSAAITWR